jgi:hypothetical protein
MPVVRTHLDFSVSGRCVKTSPAMRRAANEGFNRQSVFDRRSIEAQFLRDGICGICDGGIFSTSGGSNGAADY